MRQGNLNFGQVEEKKAKESDFDLNTPISVEEIIDLIVAEEQRILSSGGQFVFEGM